MYSYDTSKHIKCKTFTFHRKQKNMNHFVSDNDICMSQSHSSVIWSFFCKSYGRRWTTVQIEPLLTLLKDQNQVLALALPKQPSTGVTPQAGSPAVSRPCLVCRGVLLQRRRHKRSRGAKRAASSARPGRAAQHAREWRRAARRPAAGGRQAAGPRPRPAPPTRMRSFGDRRLSDPSRTMTASTRTRIVTKERCVYDFSYVTSPARFVGFGVLGE